MDSTASNQKSRNVKAGASKRKPVVTRHLVEDTVESEGKEDEDLVQDDGFSSNLTEPGYCALNGDAESNEAGNDGDEDAANQSIEDESKDLFNNDITASSTRCEDEIEFDDSGNPILPEGTIMVKPEPVRDKVEDFRGPEFHFTLKNKLKGDIENQIITCTACGQQINHKMKMSMKIHPVLKVLLCRKCFNYYNSGVFSQDENGVDEFCRWCAEGGKLICCDFCHNAFCKNCIRRNFGRKDLSEIMNLEQWQCFVCSPEKMLELHSLCQLVMEHQKKNSEVSRSAKKSRKTLGGHSDDGDLEVSENGPFVALLLKKTLFSINMLRLRTRSLLAKVKAEARQEPHSVRETCRRLKKGIVVTKHNLTVIEKEVVELQRESEGIEVNGKVGDLEVIKHRRSRVVDSWKKSAKNANADKATTSTPAKVDSEDDFLPLPKLKKTPKRNGIAALKTNSSEDLPTNLNGVEDEINDEPPEETQPHDAADASTAELVEPFSPPGNLSGSISESEKTGIDSAGSKTSDKDSKLTAGSATTKRSGKKRLSRKVSKKGGSSNGTSGKKVGGEDNEMDETIPDESEGPKDGDVAESVEDDMDVDEAVDHVSDSGLDQTLDAGLDQTLDAGVDQILDAVSDMTSDVGVEQISDAGDVSDEGPIDRCEDATDASDEEGPIDRCDDAVDASDEGDGPVAGSVDAGKKKERKKRSSVGGKAKTKTESMTRASKPTGTGEEGMKKPEVRIQLEHYESDCGSPETIPALESSIKSEPGVEETDANENAKRKLLRELQFDSDSESGDTEKAPSTPSPRGRPRLKVTPRKSPKEQKRDTRSPSSSGEDEFGEISSNRKKANRPMSRENSAASGSSDGGSRHNSLVSLKADTCDFEESDTDGASNDQKLKMKVQVNLTRLEDDSVASDFPEPNGREAKKTAKRRHRSSSESDVDLTIKRLANLGSLRKKRRRIGDERVLTKAGKKSKSDNIESLLTISSGEEEDCDLLGEDDDVESLESVLKTNSNNPDNTMNEMAKKMLEEDLKSSAGESSGSDAESGPTNKKKKTKKLKSKDEEKSGKEEEGGNGSVEAMSGESDFEARRKKKKKDVLLICKLSESDDSSAGSKSGKKAGDAKTEAKGGRKTKRRIADSDEEAVPSSPPTSSPEESKEEGDSESSLGSSIKSKTRRGKKNEKEAKKKATNKKRRRIKEVKDSSDEGGRRSDGDSDEENSDGSPNKSRKNIRRLIKDSKLHADTKAAAREEDERRRRVAERQKLYNEVVKEDSGCAITTKLCLDKNVDTEEELVTVHSKVIKKLKPHQVEGVKFLWETVCESIERMRKHSGSGCILAHCMGLGKTLQVVAFIHTLLSNKRTKVKTCLVVCPLNTVLNWYNEFDMWLDDDSLKLDVYEMASVKNNFRRAEVLKGWHEDGGVMIMGYDMFRNLVQEKGKRANKRQKETFMKSLIDPGPDVVVCDEGHILKNDNTALAKAMNRILSRRRIVLTGTPLQNNLSEYHCMVQFVKPNLLGTRKEFQNRFMNPIINGQCADSTAHDVRLMKRRAHILHNLLDGCVQRRDYNVLTPFLPPKHEYVISIRLAEIQTKLYQHFLDNFARGKMSGTKGSGLFADYQGLMKIWTHPYVLKLAEIRDENKAMYNSDDSFIDDDSEESASSSSDSEVLCLDEPSSSKGRGRGRKPKSGSENSGDEVINNWKTRRRGGRGANADEEEEFLELKDSASKEWWTEFISEDEANKLEWGGKLVLLFDILQECEAIGDKVLVFSQSLLSLDLIEKMLLKQDAENDQQQLENADKTPLPERPSWIKGLDYFRMDGSTSAELRKRWTEIFNDDESSARLFLISTRAGGLGINLVSANRVVIFDASWNPTHDVQSIFRVYRFGQKKPVYIYRFLAQGTMEEKIYDRQITKLSLSCRVVDEQQIERHFNAADLQELYIFNPHSKSKIFTPMVPKDRLLAELLIRQKDWITGYHEQDSLLENKASEELTEEERKAAWAEYEAEKKGLISATGLGLLSPTGSIDINTIIEKIQEQWPGLTQEELNEKVSHVIAWLRQQAFQQRQQQMLQQQQYIQQQQQQYMQQQQQQQQQHYLQQQAAMRQQQQQMAMYRRSWMETMPPLAGAAPNATTRNSYLLDGGTGIPPGTGTDAVTGSSMTVTSVGLNSSPAPATTNLTNSVSITPLPTSTTTEKKKKK